MDEYDYIIVESVLTNERGKHGPIHIKPIPGQDPYLETMFVQFSKVLSKNFLVGTKFKIREDNLSNWKKDFCIKSLYMAV